MVTRPSEKLAKLVSDSSWTFEYIQHEMEDLERDYDTLMVAYATLQKDNDSLAEQIRQLERGEE